MNSDSNTEVASPAFENIRSGPGRPLFQAVVQQIENKIVSGEVQPGSMLPPERVMSEQFGVSRTVIREAVKALELRGLVEVQHGRGVMVVMPSADSVVASMVRFIKIQKSPIWALHEFRSILEAEIVGLAAERRTEEDIEALQELIAQMEAKVDSPSEYVEIDFEFHRTLAKATNNPIFSLALEPMRTLMLEARRIGSLAPDAPKRSIKSHKRIVEAVVNRDSEVAKRVMREHFDKVATFITEGEAREKT